MVIFQLLLSQSKLIKLKNKGNGSDEMISLIINYKITKAFTKKFINLFNTKNIDFILG